MKRILLYSSLCLNFILLGFFSYNWYLDKIKRDYFDFRFSKFEQHNFADTSKLKVCFVGNSITANWSNLRPHFFSENNFINRGIGGHSSSQVLLRFQKDVIATNPDVVVLSIGINDIGRADGFYNHTFTLDNIQSMIDICKANDIEIIMTSLLPASKIQLNRFKKLSNIEEEVYKLSKRIEILSHKNKIHYISYHRSLKDSNRAFDKKYSFDSIHPNEEGYEIMEEIVLQKLNTIEKN